MYQLPSTANKSNTLLAMQKEDPNGDPAEHVRILEAYLDHLTSEVRANILRQTAEERKLNLVTISLQSLRTICGLYGGASDRKRWAAWLRNNHPVIRVVRRGDNLLGKVSQCTLIAKSFESERENMRYTGGELLSFIIDDFTNGTMTEPHEYVGRPREYTGRAFVEKLTQLINSKQHKSTLELIPISIPGIHGYLHWASTKPKTDRIVQGIEMAHAFIAIANALEDELGETVLPHVPFHSPFGRSYYTGFNLQSCPKELRHAALGGCVEYDLENSVYVWKYSTAKTVAREQNQAIYLPRTGEYIDYKKSRRTHVAKLLNPDDPAAALSSAKQILTAISFGATTNHNTWVEEDNGNFTFKTGALKRIAGDDGLARLKKDQWFTEFYNEQTRIAKYIGSYIQTNPDLAEHFRTVTVFRDGKGVINNNKLLAYMYQHDEFSLIKQMTKHVTAGNLLLVCHDAFYTKKPEKNIHAIKEAMRKGSELATLQRVDHGLWKPPTPEQEYVDEWGDNAAEREARLKKEAEQDHIRNM